MVFYNKRHDASVCEQEGVLIGIMPVVEDTKYLLNQLEHKNRYLPVIEKMSEYRRCEWLSVRLLLKEMLDVEKEIDYLPSGKPYIKDHSYQISISHTKGYVAAIAGKSQSVAIDIEYISPRAERIKSRFMSDEELKHLSPIHPIIHPMLYWSAKECLFKLLHESNIEFKTQLHIEPFTPIINKESTFEAKETRTNKQAQYTVHYLANEQYVITYVVDCRRKTRDERQ